VDNRSIPLNQHPLTLCVVGGGARHTPELLVTLAEQRPRIQVRSVRLMDISEERLRIVANYCRRVAAHLQYPLSIETYGDTEAAVRNADVIVIQFRVGGLQARSDDIELCLRHGLVGEETTGVGGFSLALRTIPTLLQLASAIRDSAPNALVINLSNPTGLGTELLSNQLENQVVGLCTTPWRMGTSIARRLSTPERDLHLDYFGLNHLGWVKNVISVSGEPIEKGRWLRLHSELESIKESPGLKFSEELILSLQMIPSPHLHYLYNRDSVLKALRRMPMNRAKMLLEEERQLLALYSQPDFVAPPVTSRRKGLYDLVIDLLDALANGHETDLILNVRNQGMLSMLPQDCIVEAPCVVSEAGIRLRNWRSNEDLNEHVVALMQVQKHHERLTIQAGTTGDWRTAFLALTTHTLGPSAELAPIVAKDILKTHSRLLPQFS
jgi:6-phospho-beta-glucosidase